MKKAFVAVEDENEITTKVKVELDQLAEKNHYEIQGILQYSRGVILENSEAFIEAMKRIGADCIFVTSPEFIIQEIQSDGELSEIARENNLKIIDTTLEIDIADVKEEIPDFIMKDLKSMINIKNTMDTSLEELMQKSIEKNRAMIITKHSEIDNIKELMDDLAKQGYYHFSVVEMSGYVSPMDQMIETTIRDQKINKIVVADEYESIKFHDFLKQLEGKGMEITYDSQDEIDMMMKSEFKGIFMN